MRGLRPGRRLFPRLRRRPKRGREAPGYGGSENRFHPRLLRFFQDAGERLIDTDINARKRLVLLVRDPRDVAVSYSHHEHDKEKVFTGSLDDFVRSDIYGIERQSRFVLMMLDKFDRHGGPKHYLTSEDLHRDARKTFRDRLDSIFLSDMGEAAYAYALEESRFDNMRRNEIEAPVPPFTGRLIERLNRRKNPCLARVMDRRNLSESTAFTMIVETLRPAGSGR